MKFLALGLPALAGFALMYLYPFIRTVWYSALNNTHQKEFVWFDNYREVVTNQYFQLALKNTLVFSAAGVICIVVLSLALSFGLLRLGRDRRFGFVRNFLIAPMLLPTASVIFVWQLAFRNDAYSELALHGAGAGFWTALPIFLLYIWKNTGINIIILGAAIAGVPDGIREAAALDGAAGFRIHRHITLPLITPSLLFVTTLSFVNALKSFRESYLFYQTDYPPDAAYTVQYYMNNHFRKLNYPTLTAASAVLTAVIVAVLLAMYMAEKKYNENIY